MEDQDPQATQGAPAKPALLIEFAGEGMADFSIRRQGRVSPIQMLAVRDYLEVVGEELAKAQWMPAWVAQQQQRPNLTLARGPMVPPPHNGRRN